MTSQPQLAPEERFLRSLFQRLAEARVCYAVMRNAATLPRTVAGSDLDIVVAPRHTEAARSAIIAAAREADGVTLGSARSRNLEKVFLLGRASVPPGWWGLRIDLSSGIEFKGHPLVAIEAISAVVTEQAGVVALTEPIAGVLGVVKQLLFHSEISARYHPAACRAVLQAPTSVERFLAPMGQPALAVLRRAIELGPGAPEAPTLADQLRATLQRQALRTPVKYARARLHFEWTKVKRFLRPPGAVLAVIGVDGVGKSTLIRELMEILHVATHGASVIRHLRPGVLPPLARLKGRSRAMDDGECDPHRSPPSGLLGSLVRLTYYTADYVVGYWLRVRPFVARQPGVWLFDRYAFDMMLDPRRFRLGVPPRLAKAWVGLAPAPDLVLCLHAEPVTIAARKQELPLEEIARQVSSLREFAAHHRGAILLSTEGSVSQVRDRALEEITRFFQRRHG